MIGASTNALMTLNRASVTGVVNREAGLTLHNTFAVNSLAIPCVLTAPPPVGELRRDASAVFAFDFTGLNGNTSGGGRLAEYGGSGTGAYIGFRANGNFVARCGSGSNLPNDNAAHIILTPADPNYPSGSGTLVVEFSLPSPMCRTRVWWKGVLAGAFTSIQSQTQVFGSDNAGYLTVSVQGTQPGEEVSTSLAQGTHYTTASGMRYYHNQTVA